MYYLIYMKFTPHSSIPYAHRPFPHQFHFLFIALKDHHCQVKNQSINNNTHSYRSTASTRGDFPSIRSSPASTTSSAARSFFPFLSKRIRNNRTFTLALSMQLRTRVHRTRQAGPVGSFAPN